MKNINLLPRIPLIQKLFIPMIAIIVFAAGYGAVTLYVQGTNFASEINQIETDTAVWQASIDRQLERFRVDGLTAQYKAFSQEIERLKGKQQDWQQMIEDIRRLLPEDASIAHMSTDGTVIRSTCEFADKISLAQYMDDVEQLSFVTQIQISAINRVEKELSPEQQVAAYQVVVSATIAE